MRYLILAGESSSGKSTLGWVIRTRLLSFGASCRVDSFAAPLKAAVEAMLAGTRWRVPSMPEGEYLPASDFLVGRSELREATSPDVGGSIRDYCLGVGRAARALDPDVYPKLLVARAEAARNGARDVTIVDDARFLNEPFALRRLGGGSLKIIRCQREGAPAAPPDQDLLQPGAGASLASLGVPGWDHYVPWSGYEDQKQKGKEIADALADWATGGVR